MLDMAALTDFLSRTVVEKEDASEANDEEYIETKYKVVQLSAAFATRPASAIENGGTPFIPTKTASKRF